MVLLAVLQWHQRTGRLPVVVGELDQATRVSATHCGIRHHHYPCDCEGAGGER